MPRTEHDREDLLREATALVERAELQVAGCNPLVVVGFRRDGSCSVFFGSDPVYQFNSAGQLRRAFADGLLYKAQLGRLVALRRERSAIETALIHQALDRQEEQAFLIGARQQLKNLSSALQEQRYTLIGKVPPGADVLERVRQWLANLPHELEVAQQPHTG